MIDHHRVKAIFKECMCVFGEGCDDIQDIDTFIQVKGIGSTNWFHPERLARHKEEICTMLDKLPSGFKETNGSHFKNAFRMKNGERWTYLLERADELFRLGVGIRKAKIWYDESNGLIYARTIA